jgi:hypothetical protein
MSAALFGRGARKLMNTALLSPSVDSSSESLSQMVREELDSIPLIDFHTHLFAPEMGALGLWGIDELLTYHYLEAELFRSCELRPEAYWAMPKAERAELIWRTLFVENTPVSEATRGVVAVLSSLGISAGANGLRDAREYFGSQPLNAHLQRVLELAGISKVVMTNDPLDPEEEWFWKERREFDSRFYSVLRLDRVLNKWDTHWEKIAALGYRVESQCSAATCVEVRRYLEDVCSRMKPVYLACSLPDSFAYPEESVRGRLLRDAVLPLCRERKLPLSLMIGVRYQVNPALRLAGDGVGRADLRSLERICVENPENRFFVSLLSRENQHELCVYARKFANLMPFGCWWFLNNPSIVEEITRERIEMLGASFIPQHSDARVLEQVIYKWRNTRRTLAPILTKAYATLEQDGRAVSREEIRRDVTRMFRGNFEAWAGR